MAEFTQNVDDAGKESNIITRELLEAAIRFKEGRYDIIVTDFEIKPGCIRGENYASLPFSVKVSVGVHGTTSVHNLFIKTMPNNKVARKFINSDFYFLKEGMAYATIIPDMIRCQMDRGKEHFGPSVPAYYHSIINASVGVIILEDCRPQAYLMANQRQGLDYEHCELVMKEIAVFHALSFAIKNNNPTNLSKYDNLFQESIMAVPLLKHMPKGFYASIQFIKETSKNIEMNKRVEKLLNLDLGSKLSDLIKPVEPFSFICHGDVWCNNMIFKYNQNIPVDVKLLDLQMVRYALPTTDLSFFLFTSTTKNIRDKYTRDLLFLYHNVFTESLQKLDLEFPEFTLKVLEELFNRSALFGVICACMFLPTMLTKREGLPEFSENLEMDFDLFLDVFYDKIFALEDNIPILKERLIGVMEDAITMGVI